MQSSVRPPGPTGGPGVTAPGDGAGDSVHGVGGTVPTSVRDTWAGRGLVGGPAASARPRTPRPRTGWDTEETRHFEKREALCAGGPGRGARAAGCGFRVPWGQEGLEVKSAGKVTEASRGDSFCTDRRTGGPSVASAGRASPGAHGMWTHTCGPYRPALRAWGPARQGRVAGGTGCHGHIRSLEHRLDIQVRLSIETFTPSGSSRRTGNASHASCRPRGPRRGRRSAAQVPPSIRTAPPSPGPPASPAGPAGPSLPARGSLNS